MEIGKRTIIEIEEDPDYSIFFVKLDGQFVGSFTLDDIMRLRYMTVVKSVIQELSIKENGVRLEKIAETVMKRYGLTKKDTLKFIEYLELGGRIYQPEKGQYKIVK